MSNKTISINPSLFSMGKSKTKRNKNSNAIIKPLISPNVLKNKLLQRIKEHKQQETHSNQPKQTIPEKSQSNYSDEFIDSINYLQTLSKQKQKEDIEKKTLRNYTSLYDNQPQQIINLELSEELTPHTAFQPTTNESVKIRSNNDVPYGILKGGSKPSYKEWVRTQKNSIVTNPNSSLIIQGSHEKNVRENRLQLLKQKIKQKEESVREKSLQSIPSPIAIPSVSNPSPSVSNPSPSVSYPIAIPSPSPIINNPIPNPIINNPPPNNTTLIATKHITKKTIKRKYILGKSQTKRTVGVLIKDKETRKKVLIAQKNLKKQNMDDIKKYLINHNLNKLGSNAPNDILRKMFDSAMLAGEITNVNPHNLLHNFSKENKEL